LLLCPVFASVANSYKTVIRNEKSVVTDFFYLFKSIIIIRHADIAALYIQKVLENKWKVKQTSWAELCQAQDQLALPDEVEQILAVRFQNWALQEKVWLVGTPPLFGKKNKTISRYFLKLCLLE
jgi:hypothetical protein